LHAIAGLSQPPRVGFMHVPLSPPMVAASGLDEASMDVAVMRRAVEIALEVIAAG
jgi:pyrrolidone-carboxylate peptidase